MFEKANSIKQRFKKQKLWAITEPLELKNVNNKERKKERKKERANELLKSDFEIRNCVIFSKHYYHHNCFY